MLKNLRYLIGILGALSLIVLLTWLFSAVHLKSTDTENHGPQLLPALVLLIFLAHALTSGVVITKLISKVYDHENITNYASLGLYVVMYGMIIIVFSFTFSELIVWDLLPLFYGPVCALFEMLVRPEEKLD